MRQVILLSLAFVAILAAVVLSSIGAKVLRHFSHRQLQVFCRLRKRRELFGQILDLHDEVALATEKIQIASLVVLSTCCALLFESAFPRLDRLTGIGMAVGAAALLLVTTIWIPWAVVRHCSAPFLMRTWWLWRLAYRILWPLTIGAQIVDAVFRRLAGQPDKMEKEEEEEAFEDEIMTMVTAGQREGLLEADAREMIEGVIELGDADVSDIMTPRSKVDALDVDLNWGEMLRFVIEAGRTRFPVYERTLDNVIGVLYVKDLLPELAKRSTEPRKPLRALLRELWLIPSTIPLDDLLQEFLDNRMHLAVVVDEYGAVEGVVTIEDVLEEIVGEIVDESESDRERKEDILQLTETKSEVLGTVHLDTINERLGMNLPESDDFDTIAGFVINRLGRIPKGGESVEDHGVRITVLEAKPRQVERVLVDTGDDVGRDMA